MGLYDGPRQVITGTISAAVFLAMFFGMALVWWLALALAIGVYAALLLIIPRKRRADEIMHGRAVTQADMENAAAALKGHALRLDRSQRGLPEADREAVSAMSMHLLSIRENVLKDPDDYRTTRRFIYTYLPNMVQAVESYAGLTGKASGEQAERVALLGEQIRNYVPIVSEIDRACVENDLMGLEAEVDALGTQLSRRLK